MVVTVDTIQIPLALPQSEINSSADQPHVPAVRINPPETTTTLTDPDMHAGLDIPNYEQWDGPVSNCETNHRWDQKYKSGTSIISIYRGGLQIWTKGWEVYGGLYFAASPDLATKEQQMYIAEKILRDQGSRAWPVCARGLRFDRRPLK